MKNNALNSNKQWPTQAMVGYVDCKATGSANEITTEQLTHYNVVIFGFADFAGHVSPEVQDMIATIKSKQTVETLNLISVGGALATGTVTSEGMKQLVATAKQLELDGVDLDFEDGSMNATELLPVIEELRQDLNNEGMLLTAAPILAGAPDAPTLNIPNGGPSLDAIFAAVRFDAILVQAYNSGLNFEYPLPRNPETMVKENSADIISAAYQALDTKPNQPIHSDTQIVMGIPANAGGAPTASNCWNVDDYETVPPLIEQNLSEIRNGEYGIDNRRFGGLMMWSLNTDAGPQYYPGYQNLYQNGPAGYFAQHVAPLVIN